MLIEHSAEVVTIMGTMPLYQARCIRGECYWMGEPVGDVRLAESSTAAHHFFTQEGPAEDWEIPQPWLVHTTGVTGHALARARKELPIRWSDQFGGHTDREAQLVIIRNNQADVLLLPLLELADLTAMSNDQVDDILITLGFADPLELAQYGVPSDEYEFEARALVALQEQDALTADTLWAVFAAATGGDPHFGPRGAGCWDYLLGWLVWDLEHSHDSDQPDGAETTLALDEDPS